MVSFISVQQLRDRIIIKLTFSFVGNTLDVNYLTI